MKKNTLYLELFSVALDTCEYDDLKNCPQLLYYLECQCDLKYFTLSCSTTWRTTLSHFLNRVVTILDWTRLV